MPSHRTRSCSTRRRSMPSRSRARAAARASRSGTDDMLHQLRELGELKDQGILTEAEFTAQKARILGT